MIRQAYLMKIHSLYVITILFLFFKCSYGLKTHSNTNLKTNRSEKNKESLIKKNLFKENHNGSKTLKGLKTSETKKNYKNKKTIISETIPNLNFLQTKLKKLIDNPRSLKSNFTLLYTNGTQFKILNQISNKTIIYNINKPFDEFQFGFNITEGCSINNCNYPSVCLDKNTCACGNYLANFFSAENEKEKNIFSSNNKIFCTYRRKDKLRLSVFELFLPGVGFIYNGFYLYGSIKFFISLILITIIILKLGRFLEKDKLPTGIDDVEFIEYRKDFHFYLMIVSYAILVIWTFVDLITISYRFRTDPNGVNFRLGYLIDEILS